MEEKKDTQTGQNLDTEITELASGKIGTPLCLSSCFFPLLSISDSPQKCHRELVATIPDTADDGASPIPVSLDSPVSRVRAHKMDSTIKELAIMYKQENYPLRINTHRFGTKVSIGGKNSLTSKFLLNSCLVRKGSLWRLAFSIPNIAGFHPALELVCN